MAPTLLSFRAGMIEANVVLPCSGEPANGQALGGQEAVSTIV